MKSKVIGLREVILNADNIGDVNACEHEATSYKYASRKTRNGIRNAVAKRRKEFSEADGHSGRAAK